jgi:DNA-binding beta-propeller fold protein YncE
MNYLRRQSPGEGEAFRWLSREIAGVPVLLEAHGPPYQRFSRVAMNTGLPTVLGWEYHLFQQAHSREEIEARARDVQELYSTTDLARAEHLLRKYHIDLVFVGQLERETYPTRGLAKFTDWPLVQPIFRNPEVTIYATPGITQTAKTWIDKVPPNPPTAPPAVARLREPRGVAMAPDGTFYIADFGNRRIQHLDKELEPLGAFGSQGDGPGEFRDPCGVAVATDGSVYVADTWNHRVQKFAPEGRYLLEWHADFFGPRGIAVAPDGSVFVTDSGNHRVVRFTPEGESRVLIDRKNLEAPVGIAISGKGDIYVADAGHHRVAVFSPEGELLREWAVDGWNPGALIEPYLAIGPDGVVWVTDPSGRRVLLYDRDGKPLGTATPQSRLEVPIGVTVVDGRNAAVSDAAGNSVVMVRREGAEPSPPGPVKEQAPGRRTPSRRERSPKASAASAQPPLLSATK